MSYSSHKHKSLEKRGKLSSLGKNMLVVSVKMWCKNIILTLHFELKEL